MTEPASQPQQIALQNVTANEIRIGSITQTIHYTQRQMALGSVVNEGLPPLPSAEIWQERDEESQLREWLMGGKLRLVGLEGAGGYGKSATAAKVCKTDLGFDRAPLWINFQIPIAFGTFARWIIRKLAGEVLYDQMRETYERLSDAELVEKVLSDLTENRYLLVMDNLETLFQSEELWGPYGDFLDSWLGRSGGGCVLLTSQYRLKLPMGNVRKWIGLKGLTVGQGVALLQGEGVVGELSDMEAFVEAADGHPLLLTLAINLLKTQEEEEQESPEVLRLGKSSVAMLWEIVEMHRGDAEASVGKVLDASFDRLYPEWMRVLLWRSSVLRVNFGLEEAQAMVDESVDLSNLLHLARWSFLQEEKADREWKFNFLPLIARYLQSGAEEQQELNIAHEKAIGFYEAHYQKWDGTIESCRSELEGFYHACELGEYQRAMEILDRCFNSLDLAGEWPSLLPLVERLTSEWNAADDAEEENLGWAWSRSGVLYYRLGDVQLAIGDYLKAQAIFDRLDFPEGKAAVFCTLGNAYDLLGDYQKAIDFHSQHNEMALAIGDKKGIAASLGNLGNAYQSLGDYQKAIDFHSQYNDMAQAISDKQGIANSLGSLGIAYKSLGDYQKAIDFHSQHNEMAQAIGDKKGIAISLNNLGNAYQSLGDYQKAIDFHSQSIEIKQAIGDKKGIAASLGNLGNAYQSLGDYQKAIDFHSQSIEIAQAIGDKRCIAKSLGSVGNAYHSLGKYQKAIDFHLKSMEIKQAIGDKAGVARSLFNLSNVYQQRRRLKLAMHYRHQAYRIWQDMNLPLAAAPFPAWNKSLIQSMGDTWAEQLIASDKAMAWLMLPLGYLLFALRTLLSPLTHLQKKLKIKPLWFWFCVGITIVFLIAWLKK